jgi:hypothetical protein
VSPWTAKSISVVLPSRTSCNLVSFSVQTDGNELPTREVAAFFNSNDEKFAGLQGHAKTPTGHALIDRIRDNHAAMLEVLTKI